MLKIQRTTNGEVVLAVSGELEAHNLSELSALLAALPSARTVALDLKDLVLVDRDAIAFLRACKGRGIALRNCPPYVRTWMASGTDEESWGSSGH